MLRKSPAFSLCHATARLPRGWVNAFETWMKRADHPEEIDYVLTVDQQDYTEALRQDVYQVVHDSTAPMPKKFHLNVNMGRPCAVDAWNSSAMASTGKFLITVSDDWTPPEHWDTLLTLASPDFNGEHVVDVRTSGPAGIMMFSLLTRAYFERYGRIFHPGYIGMYADNDFTAQVMTDDQKTPGLYVNARHLEFPHAHPAYGTAENDDIYRRQHRMEAWRVGKKMLQSRFPGAVKDNLVIVYPGETFSAKWVSHMLNLCNVLGAHFSLNPFQVYSSNVYITRACAAKEIIERTSKSFAPADYVLWLDDDNVLDPDQFKLMFDDLQRHPDLDAVTGWCFVAVDGYATADPRTSVGSMTPDMVAHLYTYDQLMALEDVMGGSRETTEQSPLAPVGHSGFPCMLMRAQMLEKLGWEAFLPIHNDKLPWKITGEDFSFMYRANCAGLKVAVDRRVKVPHLKLRDADPLAFQARLQQAGIDGKQPAASPTGVHAEVAAA